MSAFYDLASLVVVPSGYKSGKIYAQKPLTTDGQLTFSRASTATRVNSAGLIETVSSNVPRLDYLGATCGPRLNLEPQRTNVNIYSESFGLSGSLTLATATYNTTTSPDGYVSADSFLDTTDNNIHALLNVFAKAASPVTYTYSLFVKAKDSGMKIQLSMDDAAVGGGDSGIFNPSTGTFITNMSTPTAGYTNPSRSVTSYGNGWYRISFTITTSTATFNRYNAFLINASNSTVYAGTGTGVYVWGAMLEQGAYPTSYVKTEAAAVTRLKDECSKTGISSLIGQTEGVLFADFVVNGRAQAANIFNSEKNTTASFFLSAFTNGNIDAGLYASGSPVGRITAGSVSVGQRAKVAYAYKSGSCALYINGTQVGTSSGTFTLPSTLDDLFLNDPTTYFAWQENVSFNQALLFKTRLTNAQLAELTAL